MKITTTITISLLCLVVTANAFAQYRDVPQATFNRTVEETQALLNSGRYLVRGTPTIVTTLPGWEGLNLEQYTYSIPKDANRDGELTGTVVMYNPSADRLIKWVINALAKEGIRASYKNIMLVIKAINEASNAQFPVRGVVYEDQNCGDRIFETYAFFDGVTVEHSEFGIKTYSQPCVFSGNRLTEMQKTKYLKMVKNDVGTVGLYARIASTTREEFNAVFPGVNTKDKNWSDVVRETYKKAMQSETNDLIYASIHSKKGLTVRVKKTLTNGKTRFVPTYIYFESPKEIS